ncbi:unnamed protein product [Medioppia subpectinata]|uniref:EamA domain-containing protein n=1 Tax=Medioppia subpectinata TaxID=1979941 RepID=A0A7R9KN91_9ACAR|nr:unnamed protein product [Medioppia subpectinata]CAG2106652.1 unnamed protein product [Medioppia subpectinata]
MPLLNEKTVADILLAQQQTQQANGGHLQELEGGVKQKMLTNTDDHPIMCMDVEKGSSKFTAPAGAIGSDKRSLPDRIPAFGLLMALISVVCFSIGSVIVKVLTEMHTIQVLVIRCVIQFIFYTITALIYRYPLMAPKGHRVDLTLRCISGTISLIAIFMAYRLMPLADASTIHFASPVFVTIFAYFILKEPLTVLQVLTGTITLTGVVIIAKPEFLFGAETESVHESRLLGTCLASVAAVTASLSMITLRRLKSTPVAVVVMWYSGTVVIAGTVILVILGKLTLPTGWWTWTLLAGIGLCGVGDQYFLTVAFKYESAGPVSVTRTFNIVLSFIWEVVLLQESIEWTSILGACLVSSCVVILAMDKWHQESPQLFRRLRHKLFGCRCCCRGVRDVDGSEGGGDVVTKPRSMSRDTAGGSADSLDSIVVQSTVHSNAILLGGHSSDEDDHGGRRERA